MEKTNARRLDHLDQDPLPASPLLEKGFVRFTVPTPKEADFMSLRKAFDDLPVDRYGEGQGRFRRYGQAILTPWELKLSWVPNLVDEEGNDVQTYFQDEFNPDFASSLRLFPPVKHTTKANALMHSLIRTDLELTPYVSATQALRVGVHLIKMEPSTTPAVASPDVLHQDGEPFTFVHLVSRENVTGGTNTIAPAQFAGVHPDALDRELVLTQFDLENPLDSYGVADELVSHYVAPVERAPGATTGWRSVLLIDFTPLAPKLVQPKA